MLKLSELKERLESLPSRRVEKHLESLFGQYFHLLSEHHKSLEKARNDMEWILKVKEDADFERDVLMEIKKAVREAKKVYKAIEEEAEAVKKKATGTLVENIKLSADKANDLCDLHWKRKTENQYSQIANVVEKLPNTGGKEFKNAVDSLGRQPIPQTAEQVKKVKELIEATRGGVSKLELEGPFGKFLEAATEGTASISDVLKPEIKSKLDEYKLWHSFQVRLN